MGKTAALRFVAALAVGVCAPGASAVTLIPTYPVTLTPAEAATLERIVCKNTGRLPAEKIDAWTYERAAKNASAEVLCRRDGNLKGRPMRYFARCQRKDANWSCEDGDTEVLVTAGARELALRFGGTADRMLGIQLVEKLVGTGWFRKELDEGESPQCYVKQGAAPEWLDVTCAGWTIIASSWCPQGDCPRIVSAHRGSY